MGALLTLAVGWLLLQARAAERELNAAQLTAQRVRDEFLAGRQPSDLELAGLRKHTTAARQATSGAWWTAVASLPWLGRPLRTAHGITVAADDMATEVFPDLVRLRQVVDPASILRQDSGGVNLDVLAAADPVLAHLQLGLDRVRRHVDSLPSATGLGSVNAARAELATRLSHLAKTTEYARTAARLLEPALGGSGPRSYFFAFETNAEARGTGGLVGAFGILTADHGRIAVHDVSSDEKLVASTEPVADFGPEFESRYAATGSTQLLANSNLSAHFPYAAQIWTGLWHRQTGQQLDGAIATDPVGLARLLEAVGPLRLPDGEELTAANAVALTESVEYASYTDQAARKRFLVELAQTVTEALLHGHHDPVKLLRAVGDLARDGRLRVWSADPGVQASLEDTVLAGSVPAKPGPYAALVLNNAAGNKLDYYLDRSLTYELGPCSGRGRESVIRVKLTNNAPAVGLPVYTALRSDDPTHTHPLGSTLTWISLYTSLGAQLEKAVLDGQPLMLSAGLELGHPVFSGEVELGPGQTREIDIRLHEPASAQEPVVPVQPLARPQTTSVVASPCPEGA